MPSKKGFGYCHVGKPIWWFLESVPLVRINNVGYRNILGLHGGNDRIAFGYFAAYIVGAVKDQHGLFDILDLVDG